MPNNGAPDLHDQILFVAETVGQLAERFDKIEHENTAASQSVQAARQLFDGTREALDAAIAGIKALNFHVLDNNLGAVSSRLSEVEKQADTALKALDAKIENTTKALATLAVDTSRNLETVNGARHELAQKRDADAVEFSQKVEAIRGEITALQQTLAERIDAAKKEFATPATLNPSGKYQPNRLYKRLDLVEFNGSSYLSTEDGNDEQPGRGSKKWQTVARRGAAAGGGGSTPEPASLQTLTDGATVTWDLINPVATVTLGGNRTVAFQNERAGGTYIFHVLQDGTGSRTLTWPSNVKWPGGLTPTLTTTAAYRDVFTFTSDGTYMFGTYVQNYAV